MRALVRKVIEWAYPSLKSRDKWVAHLVGQRVSFEIEADGTFPRRIIAPVVDAHMIRAGEFPEKAEIKTYYAVWNDFDRRVVGYMTEEQIRKDWHR